MTSWKDPSYFLLLIPLAVIVLINTWRKAKRQPSFQFSSVQLLKGVNLGWRSRVAWLPNALRVAAIVLMIVALTRPQESDTKVKRNVEGIDIVIAFDISDSMLIEDMKPAENRLEAAKEVLRQFVQKRVSDRIGLVLFSGEAFTKVPPTLDYKLVLKAVDEINIERNIKMGTAIGVALANAVSHLKDSTAKSRVIIFMTDGENNSGTIDPETALEIAKGYSLKIYSIGIGVDGMAQLPVYTVDPFGNKRKHYQPMHSTVNDELLGKMASETGGKYYRATNEQALENIFSDISRLEKTKIEVNKFTKYTELFQGYLRWALILYLLSILSGRILLRRGP